MNRTELNWTKLNWIKLNRTEQNRNELNWKELNELNWIKTEQNRNELNWKELNELHWIKLNRTKLNWAKLNWTELNWTKLNWTELKPSSNALHRTHRRLPPETATLTDACPDWWTIQESWWGLRVQCFRRCSPRPRQTCWALFPSWSGRPWGTWTRIPLPPYSSEHTQVTLTASTLRHQVLFSVKTEFTNWGAGGAILQKREKYRTLSTSQGKLLVQICKFPSKLIFFLNWISVQLCCNCMVT